MNPYLVEPPAVFSFSGGRSSAFALRKALDAHGGRFPEGVHVLFANTGKERQETLDFVRECSLRWSVNVRWIEWCRDVPRYREVTYETASRKGEPFEALIDWKGFLPNPLQRICTQHLKIEPMKRFIVMTLGIPQWTTVVGIRYDEPKRWGIVGPDRRNRREFKVAPMIDDEVTEADVLRFWRQQPFDLALRTWEGNCDLCFLKGQIKRMRIMRDRPDLVPWWIEQERRLRDTKYATGRVFRANRQGYAALFDQVQRTPHLPGFMQAEDTARAALEGQLVGEARARFAPPLRRRLPVMGLRLPGFEDLDGLAAIEADAELEAEEDQLPCACHD